MDLCLRCAKLGRSLPATRNVAVMSPYKVETRNNLLIFMFNCKLNGNLQPQCQSDIELEINKLKQVKQKLFIVLIVHVKS